MARGGLAESWFFRRAYGLRVGGTYRELSFGISYRKALAKFYIQLDYAFASPNDFIGDEFGTHRIALVWKVLQQTSRN